MIRIVVADDQTLVRQGIRTLLELDPELRVVAEASDGEEALRLVREHKPDVLLLDVRMPKKTGLEVLQSLGDQAPPSLLLTTFDDDSVALAAIRLGARGFLLKDVTREELGQAVRVVFQGGTLFKPGVTERVQRGAQRLRGSFPSSALPDPLTPRELEVLRLMAAGHSNKEIAQALHMAEGTAKNHASVVLWKLGVRDRTRAVLRALELGVL